jgi:hypothetical protein
MDAGSRDRPASAAKTKAKQPNPLRLPPNMYFGEVSGWRVQKLILKP